MLTVLIALVAPVVLASGLALILRRTGHGLVWQAMAFLGVGLAVLCLVLPVDAYLGSKARYPDVLAIGLGYLVPAVVLVIVSLKRWPKAAPSDPTLELSQ